MNKKLFSDIYKFTALLVAGAAFAACSSDDNAVSEAPQQPAATETPVYTMTVDAQKGDDAAARANRALADGGTTLTATWATTDEIYVKKGDTWATGHLTPQSAGANAQLKGDLSGVTFAVDDELTLQYPNNNDTPDYTGQDGTLETIASTYDYVKATGVKVTAVDGSEITTEDATFESQQAIVKFTLKDKSTSSDLNVTALTVTVGSTSYAVTPASATNVLYVALPGFTSQSITLTATGSDSKTYTYEKASVSFTNGLYYRINVKMTEYTVPGLLTGAFTVNAGGTQVKFSQGNLQATYNGSSWSWAFATNQWDYIGNAEGNTKVSASTPFVSGYSGSSTTVDLFGWVGASSTWTDVAQYGITSSTTTNNTNGYGNNASEALKSDWGNTIGSGWRTLTSAEWTYLSNTRTTGGTVFGTSSARYAHATINTDGTSVNGMILFPDGVDIASTEVTTAGTVNGNSAWGTKCTSAQWAVLAAKGCVFLPAAGFRYGTSVDTVGSYGIYWSSTVYNANYAYNVFFYSGNLNPANLNYRSNGLSVRLVRQVE